MVDLVLEGVDPGIVDTALTALRLDFDRRELHVYSKVWNNVTRRERNKAIIDEEFLKDIEVSTLEPLGSNQAATFLGIEGYRQRGMNLYQDQAMLAMVDRLEEVLPRAVIIDNIGMKQIVTVPLLKLFHVNRFSKSSNHADRVSAARVALRRGIMDEDINKLLSDYVLDNLEGRTWSLESTQTV
ncbi:RuvC-like resolvase [Microbacterium phage YellowPanda]|uniref:RuvC-like resolvase n=2 Tax=Tinytimothyvirus tinytimothy TaxID=2845596 RepID=A0A5Q2WM64_9CAUD|nr:hypothetical protein HWC33_gp08 [Microbacterium phage TinyTimothy]QDF16961.1 hypothetical protein SEA_TINYTIMOTHY_8 [Microbacterium phage TinyTimothy]QGH78649.1 hypothetical protein SEA_WESAK_8 [Microbacterium phage Wesak]